MISRQKYYVLDFWTQVIGGGSGGLACSKQAAKLGKTMADVAKGSKVGAACAALLNEALGSEDKDGDVRPSGKGESLLNKIDLKGMLAARRKDKVASED